MHILSYAKTLVRPAAMAACLLGLCLRGGPALAQYADPDVEKYSDRFEPDVIVGGITPMGNERMYVVQPGDTLWDISANLTGDNLLWPHLWSLNPHITNPHWIYPGDVLFIRAAPKSEDTSFRFMDSRFADAPPPKTVATRLIGFIAEEEYQESGKLRFAREEKAYLSHFDEIYVEFGAGQAPQVGEQYTVYRTEREVTHPGTDEVVGHVVRFLGTMRVLDTSSQLTKAVVLEAHHEMKRGDLITSIFPHRRDTSPVTNTVELDGVILDMFEEQNMAGQYQYAFIDKGQSQGVRSGNRFVTQEVGDPYFKTHRTESQDEDDAAFPIERSGEAMVVEAYEHHCLAILTSSIHELKRGDRVHLPMNY